MAISFNSLGGYGRLGNQMFQYAAVKGIAHNRGYEFSIPNTGHLLFEIFEMRGCAKREVNPIVMQSMTHSGFEFDENLFKTCPDHTDLFGYFQTEKYFSSIKDLIISDFTFINQESDHLDVVKNSVAIHVRRGDYLGLQTYHPVATMGYYKRAMELLSGHDFVLFSDDVNWCREEETFKDCQVLDVSDAEAMFLMSHACHNIIANSSFSWWGAWLNGSDGKIIVAPERWFGPSYEGYNLKDLYPEGWNVL